MATPRVLACDDLQRGVTAITVGCSSECRAAPPSAAAVTHGYATVGYASAGDTNRVHGSEWRLAEGDVIVVPPGTPHRPVKLHGQTFWGLAFHVPAFLTRGDPILLEPFERVRDGAAAVARVAKDRRPHLESLFRELERTCRDPGARGRAPDAVQHSLLTLILNELQVAMGGAAPHRPRSSVVADSLRYIERNCRTRLTLGEVAAAVGRSPAYVTNLVKQVTGRSVGAWIVNARMAEARRLLLHSDEMVDVIAERVGYADATHFIRMFRREHGATPAAWRAAQVIGSR